MGDLLPQITAAFGNPVGETVFVAVVPDCESKQAKRSDAVTSSSGIIVYDTKPDRIAGTLGHELVHVVVSHRTSFWNTLPPILEEGLCGLVDYGLTGANEVVLEGCVPTRLWQHYLGMGPDDLISLEGDDRLFAHRIAAHLAGFLGFDRIEALCRRAHSEGHAVIPTEWILAAVEEVERLRQSDFPAPPPLALDPLFGRIEASVPRKNRVKIWVDFSGRESEGAQVDEASR